MKQKSKRNIIRNKDQILLPLDNLDYVPIQKKHPWEQVEGIYRTKLRVVDKNLHQMYDYLKPQAQSIFFDRKVEFQNVIDDKLLAEQNDLTNIHRAMEKDSNLKNYDQGIEKIKDIMIKYDIKHPLRGEEFEGFGRQKQPFSNKIQGIAGTNNSYMGYKKDLRKTLDFTMINSEDHKKKEMIEFQKQRTEMKYRIYGKEGINEREFQKLKDWGVVKAMKEPKKTRVKRKVKKIRNNSEGQESFYTSEDSRSCDSAFTIQKEILFEQNTGNPTEVNMGFEIQPLCPELYGKKAAHHSKLMHFNKQVNLKQMHTNQQQFNTIEVGTQFTSKRQSKTRNQRERTPIEMPELRKKKNPLNASFDYRQTIKQSHDGSLNSIIQKSDFNHIDRKPKKMLMPHLVNKYELHNSISDLYAHETEITARVCETDESVRLSKNKMQFIHPSYTQQKIQTITSRVARTQMNSSLNYQSIVTPRIGSRLSNYGIVKSPLKSNIERKKEGGGRMNKMYTERTPKVTDNEIKTLVSKYPHGEKKEKKKINQNESEITDNILAQISQSEIYKEIYEKHDNSRSHRFAVKRKSQSTLNKENNQKIKTQLEFMGRNIDKMQSQSKTYYRDLMTKMVLQNFRDEELLKIQEFIKEIDFAEVDSMPGLYELKMKDELERLKVIKEVSKDYNDSKLNTGKMMKVKKLRK